MILRASRLGLVLGCLLNACAPAPAVRLTAQAQAFGLQTLALHGQAFTLTSFFKPSSSNRQTLHVYIEGDGVPWAEGRVPAADPTTLQSVLLPLMNQDYGPALYLGRPCYNGHADDTACSPRLWTQARYGQEVVQAMYAALDSFARQNGFSDVVLIGHSGGGALAWLIADAMPNVQHVVTLAGNYDIDAWASHHGYQRLNGSINPARHANHGADEWHFLAENDRVIPAELFVSELKKRSNSRVEIVPDIDHVHGWSTIWPEVLSRLRDRGR